MAVSWREAEAMCATSPGIAQCSGFQEETVRAEDASFLKKLVDLVVSNTARDAAVRPYVACRQSVTPFVKPRCWLGQSARTRQSPLCSQPEWP